jgi:hypothetical protein
LENKFGHLRNTFFKFIYNFLLMVGLLGSALALFTVFCLWLPDIEWLIVPNHKVDPLILEGVYKWMTISTAVAAIAGGILALSIVGLWFDIKKWWKECKQSDANPRLAKRRLAVIIVIVTLIAIGSVISFVIGKNGW